MEGLDLLAKVVNHRVVTCNYISFQKCYRCKGGRSLHGKSAVFVFVFASSCNSCLKFPPAVAYPHYSLVKLVVTLLSSEQYSLCSSAVHKRH
jgi:hypothetical protein